MFSNGVYGARKQVEMSNKTSTKGKRPHISKVTLIQLSLSNPSCRNTLISVRLSEAPNPTTPQWCGGSAWSSWASGRWGTLLPMASPRQRSLPRWAVCLLSVGVTFISPHTLSMFGGRSEGCFLWGKMEVYWFPSGFVLLKKRTSKGENVAESKGIKKKK